MLVTGDMDSIWGQADKSGGSTVNSQQTKDFQNFIQDIGLMDLGYVGPAYIWTNRKMTKWHMKERLERSVVNVEWKMFFSYTSVYHLPRIVSDHSPIYTNLLGDNRRRKTTFKLKSMWTLRKDFETMLNSSWSNSTPVNKLYLQDQANPSTDQKVEKEEF